MLTYSSASLASLIKSGRQAASLMGRSCETIITPGAGAVGEELGKLTPDFHEAEVRAFFKISSSLFPFVSLMLAL